MKRHLWVTFTVLLVLQTFHPVVCYHLHDLQAFMATGRLEGTGRRENRKETPWIKSANSYNGRKQGYQPFPVIFDLQQRQQAQELVQKIVNKLRLLMSKPNLDALMNTLDCDDPTHGHSGGLLPVPHSNDFHEAALVLLLALAGCPAQSEERLQRAIATSGLDAVIQLLKDMHTLTSSIPVYKPSPPPEKVELKTEQGGKPRFLLTPNDLV
ncbi:uncharacterized protein LOC106164142 [Lingula anatina]|uniref:Uncharacterized protein LOC106164142 n=1 Tax=Lingula anatina TaxID=7574 RepID=A0A1S3I6Z3_LINAN|nr:uncharacterized protein LOC106164142 [Lingula anatina]|eukprot:XP_013397398.1 uncharacterized protein LOC106164142 [Lingula anatina]